MALKCANATLVTQEFTDIQITPYKSNLGFLIYFTSGLLEDDEHQNL